MPPFLFLLPALLLLTAPALAEDCRDAATQTDMNICYSNAYRQRDAELNRVYGALRKGLGDRSEEIGLLVAAQRAWIAFRDAECAYSASSVSGGSLYPTVMAMCLDEVTHERIEKLKSYGECAEGDLDCPAIGR